MIRYPALKKGACIGVTAPSSGVDEELHELLRAACSRMEERGFSVACGETPWTQDKAKSASAFKRAAELNEMMKDEKIDLIVPPWGGELLIEVLEHLDFDQFQLKWILGYSDISLLLLAVTLTTGMATAHGTNLVDLRGTEMDSVTAMWQKVLAVEPGGSIRQVSSQKYQREWRHDKPSPHVFHLTEETNWKSVSGDAVYIKGRLLGGCIDVIRHLIGTPFGRLEQFRDTHIPGEPLIWYLENCELSTADLRRTLVQMKLAGWFDHCAGILFGRSPANHPIGNYEALDVYKDLASELGIPVVYNMDCGHVPPQLTFINGAYAEVEAEEGHGMVLQHFR